MPPRTRARSAAAKASSQGPTPLTDTDLETLKERLEAGKRPRVQLLVDTALGAAGTTVPLVGFGDPADGEFILVRLRDDVVPFAPTELAMPQRGRAAAPAPQSAPPAVQPERAPAPVPARLPLDPPRLVAVPDPVSDALSDAASEAGAKDAPSSAASSAMPSAGQPPEAPSGTPAKKSARRPGKPGSLAVTLRFTGEAWTYESSRSGKRSPARPLHLAAVRAFADRLEDQALRRDMQAAIDVCRQQVQSRAQALRAELEQMEIQLAELDD